MGLEVYRARHPKKSPLWQCIATHFETFLKRYESAYESTYGFMRPVIPEVVRNYQDCGCLKQGFARVRCEHCAYEYLLAFSCKGRWFCPSCHQKKVQEFGLLLSKSILHPVAHRHYTFGIPKMLRIYYRHDRDLLKDLCRLAKECVTTYIEETLGFREGVVGMVMVIHTFGDYLDFHPHLHALVTDGLFSCSGRPLIPLYSCLTKEMIV